MFAQRGSFRFVEKKNASEILRKAVKLQRKLLTQFSVVKCARTFPESWHAHVDCKGGHFSFFFAESCQPIFCLSYFRKLIFFWSEGGISERSCHVLNESVSQVLDESIFSSTCLWLKCIVVQWQIGH